ncbi:hypothetical protein B5807_04157 [Epicoccum nigrum]|uniref:Uncharacterized protein n=1 Tax=Epicoccum nigrum TaxID=105696 RepID=A0A1Y2M5B0_EPING|nr:hypothetical protein B5807_04157 [Epicoccum nigrum]
MSLPRMKKRFQDLRAESKRQGKLSAESLASNQQQNDDVQLSRTAPASTAIGNQHDRTLGHGDTSHGEPTRKRDCIQQWLAHQKQRQKRCLERVKHNYRGHHRDSMFDEEDIEQELSRASAEANSIIKGPDGEPIDQRVIDHFFMLHQSSGSAWRDSVQWERHSAICLRRQCDVCQSDRFLTKRCTWQPSSPSSARPDPPKDPKPSEKPKLSKEINFRIPRWHLEPRKRKINRGKSVDRTGEFQDKDTSLFTGDELMHIFEALETPRARFAKQQPEQPTPNLAIRDRIQRIRNKPVICTFVNKRLDPNKIPVPAVPDLKPGDSKNFNIALPAHQTGRPYSPCPLEEGRLPFPLCRGRIMPPTPELKPEQCIESVTEPLQLAAPRQEIPDGGLFPMSPLDSPNPSTTNLQRQNRRRQTSHDALCQAGQAGLRQTIRLVGPCAQKLLLAWPLDQPPAPEPESEALKSPPIVAETAAKAISRHTNNHNHNNKSGYGFPPTPPDSRHNSETFPSGFVYTSYSLKVPAPEPTPMPPGPADRDWNTCRLSDTTGSSSPDCLVYVNPREGRIRRGSGMGIFR